MAAVSPFYTGSVSLLFTLVMKNTFLFLVCLSPKKGLVCQNSLFLPSFAVFQKKSQKSIAVAHQSRARGHFELSVFRETHFVFQDIEKLHLKCPAK